MRTRTKAIYIISVITMLYSLVRWGGIIYTDYSTAAIFTFAGLVIAGSGYLWDWMEDRTQHEQLMNKRLDSLIQDLHSCKEVNNLK